MKKLLQTSKTLASAGHESIFPFPEVRKSERAFIQWNVQEETTENGFGGARIVESQLREGSRHSFQGIVDTAVVEAGLVFLEDCRSPLPLLCVSDDM